MIERNAAGGKGAPVRCPVLSEAAAASLYMDPESPTPRNSFLTSICFIGDKQRIAETLRGIRKQGKAQMPIIRGGWTRW